MRDDGKHYLVEYLYPDQKKVVAEIMAKLKEWLECDDPANFEPVRMTINGSGGSGKSVVINTLVSLFRRMFATDDVVRVAAPTGVAAFNVGGETFHHMLGNAVTKGEYKASSMNSDKRKRLVTKFKTLLALIVDERSLVTVKDFGTCETQISETIFSGGSLAHLSFGALPFVIIVGDDFQLPPSQDGAFTVLNKKGDGDMARAGRRAQGIPRLCKTRHGSGRK